MNPYPNSRYLCSLAERAGEIIRREFSLGMDIELKADSTRVTAADTDVNEFVIEAFRQDFPHIDLIAEEGSSRVEGAEYRAFCDPVDGTFPFSIGAPISAFSISIVRDQTPLVAVIYDPFMNRMWYASRGRGCFLNGSRAAVSTHATISDSSICALHWRGSPYNIGAVTEDLMNARATCINPVSVAYFGGLVASGTIEATIFPAQKALETTAIQIIVEEAGGRVTDIHGNEMRYGPEGEMKGHIISNGLVHDALLEVVHANQ